MNTLDFLTIANAICPDRACVVFEGKRFTFNQINERSNRLANALSRLGVEKGHRVAMLQVNCNEYLEAYYATAKLGGIFVPLNFRAREDELSYLLDNSGASVLFCGERYAELAGAVRPRAQSLKHIIALEKPQPDMLFYDELLSSSSPEEVFAEVGEEDVTMLLYTAGTTGRPKGVPLTHSGFAVYTMQNVEPADPEIAECNILTVPLYHVAGAQAMLTAVYGGRTLIMMKQFEVVEWMEAVERERASRAMLVPTMLKRVIEHPDFARCDLSSLKVITYGAASMPLEVIKKAIECMPWVRFINAFGQTETASTITALGPEDHIIEGTEAEKEKKLRRLSSSIGKPLPDIEMAILDEEGKELPPGAAGEIVARGPRVMSGYWQDPEKTARAFTKEGWLHTGDIGYRDEEGYFYLAGRGDDMIIRGGENISPEEVENVLHSCPQVEEAAVIAVADPEWGQQPRAVVVLKQGETATTEEIIEFCRARLAGFKRPRSVVFVEALPRNPLGKVIRKALREQYGVP